jgi:predicted permease
MQTLMQDVRYALRMLRKSPGFAIVAVLTLALGIGANTAIFSLVNGLLLHPAGIPHPSRLVAARARYDKLNLKSIVMSVPDFASVRDSRNVFAATAVMQPASFNYIAGAGPIQLQGARVSVEWFNVFETRPLLGRVFSVEEDQPNTNHEIVLSYAAWRNMFGGDAGILGRAILLNQEQYKVIGVMRPEFNWPSETQLWAPLGLAPDEYSEQNYFNESYFTVARLQPDVSVSRASAYMTVLTERVTGDPRAKFAKDAGWALFVVPLTDFVYGNVRTPLLVLLGAVGFVLLIACANVAGLTLARATGRTKELAVRVALGASRWRLVRQTLTESAVMAIAGMALGIVLASTAMQALVLLVPEKLAAGMTIHLDGYVLAFTAAAAAISALVFGAAPAWQMSHTDPQQSLREGRGAGSATRAHHRFRDALVVAQLALALVLLAGAGLFMKSLAKMRDVNVGFDPHGLVSAAVTLPAQQYDKPEKQIAFWRAVVEKVAAVPGVHSAAAAAPLPFTGFGGTASFRIEGRPLVPGDPGPHGGVREVTPGYFSTMKIPILRGREFSDEDRLGGQAVVVIDENLARDYWSLDDAVGKRLRRSDSAPWATIIGVAGAVRYSDVVGAETSDAGTMGAGKGVYYYPIEQLGTGSAFLVARASGNSSVIEDELRDAVSGIDPAQPVSDVKTMDERIAIVLGPRYSALTLLGIFAAMALALSAIGLFGLIRYSVAQRTQEFGVRMALGATQERVLKMVLSEGLKLALCGVAIGIVAALALTRILGSMLYGVSATDPVIFAEVAGILIAVALFACFLPARRATRIDPMEALRYE